MAIAYDTGTNKTGTGAISWTHTVGAGASIAVLWVHDYSVETIAPTFGGSAMTQFGTYWDAVSNERMSIWYKLNPTAGANTISVNAGFYVIGQCVTYSGVSQIKDNAQGSAINTKTYNQSLTTTVDKAWIVEGVFCGSNGISPGTGTTQEVGGHLDNFGNAGIFDSGGAESPAGSYTLQTTVGANSNLYGWIISLQPTSTPTPNYQNNGVFIFG